MKELIAGLIISQWIITNYVSVLAVIALSTASTFGKIMMYIFETLLIVATLNYLEELE